MKTLTIKAYEFDELSAKAQEKAMDWYREGNMDYQWWDTTEEDFKTLASHMGIEVSNVYFSGFWSQGDGACFEGHWSAGQVKAEALKDYAPQDEKLHRIAEGFAEVAGQFPNASFNVKHKGHYSHKYCTEFDVSIPDDEGNEIETQEAQETEKYLIELSRDLMQWLYDTLEKEYEYLNSDEEVADTIRANEYLFTAEGERTTVLG